MRSLPAHASIGGAFSDAGRECVETAGDCRCQGGQTTACARLLHPRNERVVKILAEPVAKRARIRAQGQRVYGGGDPGDHSRAFREGSSRRARAAATWPANRSASRAATVRPWRVMA